MRTLGAARVVAAGALVFALLPVAGAHLGPFREDRSLQFEDFSLVLSPQPDVLYAGDAWELSVSLFDVKRGDVVEGARIGFYPEGAEPRQITTGPGGGGTTDVGFDEPGNRTLDVTLSIGERSWAGTVAFNVYRRLPFRIEAADPAADLRTNRTETLEVAVVEGGSPARVDALGDLTSRVEHWTDDHRRLLGSEDLVLRRAAPGLWSADVEFAEPGMYHFWFASDSGGFTFMENPMLHAYVVHGPPPSSDDAPGPELVMTVLAAAGSAWVLALAVRCRA